ncbi:anthrax toxin lethal factor-related metalloendopeptidase [Peribacillus kribbensis]|uniref:anthrax toxin lethal factor-related metalloendopeptidase n=1 Tax=Peribacillus kribbensis TaxID=356658 RepID=UPI00040B8F41|nr:hypothetical protein [Peribacillus kribbensis]
MNSRWQALISSIALLVLIGSFFYGSAEAKETGRNWGQLPWEQEQIIKHHLASKDLLQNIMLFPYGNFNAEEAGQIVRRIDALPPELLKKLIARHVKIKLFTGRLTENITAESLKGKSPRGYKNKETTWDDVPGLGGTDTVLVKIGYSRQGMDHGSVNLELHELGHSIDTVVFSDYSHSSSFKKIWKRERGKLFPGSDYLERYPEEYFAETFAMYTYSKETQDNLKKSAPETYQSIRNLIK